MVMPRMPSLLFQFTPLREGRRSRGHFLLCDDYFNSRPSARGDREAHPMAEAIGKFQFTPLREGRPGRRRCTPQSPRYFNSRPSARGDFPGVRESGRRENFNSRPSARGDAGGSGWPPAGSAISIHAPPRGATDRAAADMPDKLHFNSRPSARGDRPPPEQ